MLNTVLVNFNSMPLYEYTYVNRLVLVLVLVCINTANAELGIEYSDTAGVPFDGSNYLALSHSTSVVQNAEDLSYLLCRVTHCWTTRTVSYELWYTYFSTLLLVWRDSFRGGERVSASTFASMVELCHICSLCNDSAIDFNESRKAYEKVGEATEAALTCLVERANVYQLDKSSLTSKELCASRYVPTRPDPTRPDPTRPALLVSRSRLVFSPKHIRARPKHTVGCSVQSLYIQYGLSSYTY